MNNQQFFDALLNFEPAPALRAPSGVGDSPTPGGPGNTGNLCSTYAKVRPIIEGLLPFIRAIPGIGPRVGAAIDALVAGLDVICPQQSTAALNALSATYGTGHEAFFEALRSFQVSGAPGLGAAADAAAIPTLSDICALYKKVKPILSGVLVFIALIPGFGSAAAAAIKALMAVLDGLCP